ARSGLERTLPAFSSVSYVLCEIGSVSLNTLPSKPSSSEFFRRASDVASAGTPSSDAERKRRRTSRAREVASCAPCASVRDRLAGCPLAGGASARHPATRQQN